jgi:hypothetical protein
VHLNQYALSSDSVVRVEIEKVDRSTFKFEIKELLMISIIPVRQYLCQNGSFGIGVVKTNWTRTICSLRANRAENADKVEGDGKGVHGDSRRKGFILILARW